MNYGIFNLLGNDLQNAEVRFALESLRLNLVPLIQPLKVRGVSKIDVSFFFDSSSQQGKNEVGDGYARILLNANRQPHVWGGSAVHELFHIWAFLCFGPPEEQRLCQAYGPGALWFDSVYSLSVAEAWVQAAMRVYCPGVNPQPGLNYLPWNRQPTSAVGTAIRQLMGEPGQSPPPAPPPTPTVPTPAPLPVPGALPVMPARPHNKANWGAYMADVVRYYATLPPG